MDYLYYIIYTVCRYTVCGIDPLNKMVSNKLSVIGRSRRDIIVLSESIYHTVHIQKIYQHKENYKIRKICRNIVNNLPLIFNVNNHFAVQCNLSISRIVCAQHTIWQSYQNFYRPNWFQQYYIFIQTVNVKQINNISGALNRRGKNWKRNKQM